MADRIWKVLGRDWFGEPVEPPVFYSVEMADGCLVLSARREGVADVEVGMLGFVGGLWRRDVVELFLGADGRENYLEFHVAPDGCWWACEFVGEDRKAVSDWGAAGPPGFLAEGEMGERRWEASLKMPVELLVNRLGGDVGAWRGNVAGMVSDAQGTRRYLTASRPDGGARKPDFHRRELRRRLEC